MAATSIFGSYEPITEDNIYFQSHGSDWNRYAGRIELARQTLEAELEFLENREEIILHANLYWEEFFNGLSQLARNDEKGAVERIKRLFFSDEQITRCQVEQLGELNL